MFTWMGAGGGDAVHHGLMRQSVPSPGRAIVDRH
jgi:hypothetical protein